MKQEERLAIESLSEFFEIENIILMQALSHIKNAKIAITSGDTSFALDSIEKADIILMDLMGLR